MAKTRLLVKHRDVLKNFIRSRIKTPEADKVVSERLAELNAALVPMLDKQFPLADMRVLERYGLAALRNTVSIRWSEDRYNATKEAPIAKARMIPVNYHAGNPDDLRAPPGDPIYAAIDAYRAAVSNRDNARRNMVRMYNTLIDTARNFEDLLEVWPEADLARPLLDLPAVNAIARVTAETVAFIRADCATRYPPKDGEVASE